MCGKKTVVVPYGEEAIIVFCTRDKGHEGNIHWATVTWREE